MNIQNSESKAFVVVLYCTEPASQLQELTKKIKGNKRKRAEERKYIYPYRRRGVFSCNFHYFDVERILK